MKCECARSLRSPSRWRSVSPPAVSASNGSAAAQAGALTALDYQEITQLINRYAYGIDTCANNGYDYANVFTADGVFIDRNSDAGFARRRPRPRAGARRARDARRRRQPRLRDEARLDGLEPLDAEPRDHGDGRTAPPGRIYLVQLGMNGPGSVARHGGYEDVYVRTPEGWRIKSRRTSATRRGTARSSARPI